MSTKLGLLSEPSLATQIAARSGGNVSFSIVSHGQTDALQNVGSQVDVHVTAGGGIDTVYSAMGAKHLARWLAKFPIGRLMNSLGTLDQGRVFSRAVRRSPAAMRLLREADVLIATDVVSTKLAAAAVRRGWVAEAYYDPRSASFST